MRMLNFSNFRTSVLASGSLFLLSLVASFYARIYATERASNPVADIVLSNIPVFDIEPFLIAGTLFLVVFVGVLCLLRPQRIPFILYALAILYFIRSIFVSLTHVGPFPTQITLDASEVIANMFGGADLFFSGHVGAAFLLALIFWQEWRLRYIFLASSIFFGMIVLLGHLHYSIDVLAAFFIAYGVCDIAKYFFPSEYQLLQNRFIPKSI